MIDDQKAVAVSDLRKTYSDGLFGRKKFKALKGVGFSVPRGGIFGLLGPNGAGKTTLVKIMLGIVKKSSGDADVLGFPAGSTQARSKIGYLPENLRMRRHHTANTALEFYGGLSHLSAREVRMKREKLLKRVGLEDWADAGIKKFSKGMLQRLGLAQSLLHDPELLILDEPTDGLDPQARADVREIMLDLKKEGKTIFINSHILQEVELVCDGVAILDRGELKYCGAVGDIGAFLEAKTGIQTGTGTRFMVKADQQKIESLVEPFPGDRFTCINSELTELYTRRIEPDFLNSTIDKLRQNQIEIHEVARKNVTLEEAFLQILEEDNPEDTDPVSEGRQLPA